MFSSTSIIQVRALSILHLAMPISPYAMSHDGSKVDNTVICNFQLFGGRVGRVERRALS